MLITSKTRTGLRRSIALFFLVTFLNQVFFPSVVFALTAGPTAPEATNFEPVDTTDMVNPLTGSFTYNIPLLEVPGPEGSYPLSLAYHAGIQPNEEASWVGLGWSLNPGAISRNVNGYPDDWNGGSGNVYDYLQGGSINTYSIGIGIGAEGSPASVNAGLSFSQDTYKGFGVGFDIGLNYKLGDFDTKGIQPRNFFSLGANVGISAYGDAYAGAGVSRQDAFGTTGLRSSNEIGIQTNFKTTSVGFNSGISTGGESLLGASISSSDIKPSMSVGGGSANNINNKNAGKMSSSSCGIGISIPIGGVVSISLGYNYTRYWSSTTEAFTANGVINNRISNSTDYTSGTVTGTDWSSTDDDNYSIFDPSHPGNSDPLTQTGGTFPNFDDYNVTAQGLGGTMRPYKFASVLLNQNRVNSTDHSKDVYNEVFGYSHSSAAVGKWQFRFVNDLSNNFRQGHPWVSDQIFGFDANPVSGMHQTTDVFNDGYGYDSGSNRLEGTNHVEYFTNADISTGKAALRGFITAPDEGGFKRSDCPSNQIGGFMITNASGVTYHYALPVYNVIEKYHSENINSPQGFGSTDIDKSTPYAYTWYLTAITGPDYVSRGTLGQLGKTDWGYWVKFDYGKWTKNFIWRNPSMGMAPDLDGGFQSYSTGIKEIYYLDAIETRSHTAIFEKELRADGKGMALFNNSNQTYSPVLNSPVLTGGYTSIGAHQDPTSGNAYPVPTLRLKNILLFQNDQLPIDLNSLRQSGTNYNYSFPYSGDTFAPDGIQTITTGNNLIDTYDVTANPLLLQNCLRRIAFSHDYSLCPNTINSYDQDGSSTYLTTPVVPANYLGKLTLLSVDFQGRGGQTVTPPTQFQYDLDATDPANQGRVSIYSAPDNQQESVQGPTITNGTGYGAPHTNPPMSENTGMNQQGTITVYSGNYQVGDIISFQYSGETYYCTLLSTPTNGSIYNVLFLNKSPGSASVNQIVNTVKTKNPPFHFDAYDGWQCYKSDFQSTPGNKNLSRFTTYVSSLSTDAWSLRKIQSSIGSNINLSYESNTYRKSVLNRTPSVIVSNTAGSGNKLNSDYTIDVLADLPANMTLSDLFLNNSGVSGPLMLTITGTGNDNLGTSIVSNVSAVFDLESYPLTKIVSLSGNDIKLQLDPALYSKIQTGTVNSWGNPLTVTAVSLATGNLNPNFTNNQNYGGGIRVKAIIVDDLSGNLHQTSYSYGVMGHMDDLTMSSGVTSYLPTIMDDISSTAINSDTYKNILYRRANYLTAISRQAPGPGILYESVRVTNSTSTPGGINVPLEGSTIYQYEVFKPEMIGLKEYYYEAPYSASGGTDNGDNTWWHTSTSGSGLKIVKNAARDISIKDYTSRVGNLKRIITYDNNGNKLTEKINHYLFDDLDNTSFDSQVANFEPRLATFSDVSGSTFNGVSYNDMGVLMERYATARASIDPAHVSSGVSSAQFDEMLVMSNEETYPSINTGTTQIDYKNGTQTTQTNLAFDFFTGAVTKTLTTDSYGNRFISVATPAYMAGYANGGVSTLTYPALGLKTHDDDDGSPAQHKHMLKQQSSNYTYAVDGSNIPIGVITATVQTWSNSAQVLDPDGNSAPTATQANIWRMDANYSWMPTGTTANNVSPYSSFVDYFASGGSNNASWKKLNQVTQYNVYSAALEASDINTNYAATRMGYNNSKVLLTGGPAKYNEIAYAGAEDPLLTNGKFSNQVSLGGGAVVVDSTNSHTGTSSLSVGAGLTGFNYTLASPAIQNYSVSVWVKPTASNVSQASLYYQVGSGSSITPAQTMAKTAAGWYLLEMTVPYTVLNGGNLVVGCKNGSSAMLYFDDFRFQPTTASTTAYVYDNKTGELTYILGNNNLFMRYQYDGIGRLVRTYKEVLGKTKIPINNAIVYNYAAINYHNAAVSQTFLSQNCGTGIPQPIIYTVPANRYSSTISNQDAYQQALNDIAANGQAYANTNGTCLPTISFSLSNSTNSGYHVDFTNASGTFPYDFSNNGSIPVYVPIGVYSVSIYPTGAYVTHTITLGSRPSVNAPRANFDNVNVSTGSTDLNITVF